MVAMRHAYDVLVGKTEEKINFGSLKLFLSHGSERNMASVPELDRVGSK